MKHSTFFGDGTYTFALTDDMITELERKTEIGIGALYMRAANSQFALDDLIQTIRLGLIGGGTPPEQAMLPDRHLCAQSPLRRNLCSGPRYSRCALEWPCRE